MIDQLFKLLNKDQSVAGYTQDATAIGQWVLDDPQNLVQRITLADYWKEVAEEQAFDGNLNFFTVLEQTRESALDNEDELVLHRLANLNEYDFEAYDSMFSVMSADFYSYLQHAEKQSRNVATNE